MVLCLVDARRSWTRTALCLRPRTVLSWQSHFSIFLLHGHISWPKLRLFSNGYIFHKHQKTMAVPRIRNKITRDKRESSSAVGCSSRPSLLMSVLLFWLVDRWKILLLRLLWKVLCVFRFIINRCERWCQRQCLNCVLVNILISTAHVHGSSSVFVLNYI